MAKIHYNLQHIVQIWREGALAPKSPPPPIHPLILHIEIGF